MRGLKKVLIVAHLAHASPRIPGIARYLPEFSWQPVILTAPFSEKSGMPLRVVETSYRDALGFWKRLLRLNPREDIRMQVKKRFGVTAQQSLMDFFLTRIGEFVNYPDADKGWRAFAIEAGDKLLRETEIHAVISSSSPVTSHLIAGELSRRHRLPWIADLRDLWSQNHNYSYSPVRRWFDRRLELKSLSTAGALVTVSRPWAEELGALHKEKTVYTITNGFDPDALSQGGANLTSRFTITYTGLIYAGKQAPSRLFIALRELISEHIIDPADIELRFYGPEINWLSREAEEFGLTAVTRFYGIVPREVAYEKQRESQVLLLLNWEDQRVRGWHPLKGFEYLAAQRPILAIGGSGDDVTKRLLDETKAGRYCKAVADIKEALSRFYLEYKSTGSVYYSGDRKEISKYSHREMARKYAGILDGLT